VRLRPIFHRKESRVKAHVFVCVLALLLEAMMQRKLSVPAKRALQKLKRVRVAMMDVEGEEVGVLTELDEEQMRILKELGVEAPPQIL
jgi:transposase